MLVKSRGARKIEAPSSFERLLDLFREELLRFSLVPGSPPPRVNARRRCPDRVAAFLKRSVRPDRMPCPQYREHRDRAKLCYFAAPSRVCAATRDRPPESAAFQDTPRPA